MDTVNTALIKRVPMRERLDVVCARLGLPTLDAIGYDVEEDLEQTITAEGRQDQEAIGIDQYFSVLQGHNIDAPGDIPLSARYARACRREVVENSYFGILRRSDEEDDGADDRAHGVAVSQPEQTDAIKRIMNDSTVPTDVREVCTSWFNAISSGPPNAQSVLAGDSQRWGRLRRHIGPERCREDNTGLDGEGWALLHILPYVTSNWATPHMGRAPREHEEFGVTNFLVCANYVVVVCDIGTGGRLCRYLRATYGQITQLPMLMVPSYHSIINYKDLTAQRRSVKSLPTSQSKLRSDDAQSACGTRPTAHGTRPAMHDRQNQDQRLKLLRRGFDRHRLQCMIAKIRINA
ncbi:unnamed protein product [Phytophthora fragariaefolia]|uniref:Unnamed protein product n=1 Tax=Phytophthora fragariaefolia TaxID=1490495 RepID=A0A9W7D092_9STRA|nr:unnamed protein product [Phytophthora fragariaefolia]